MVTAVFIVDFIVAFIVDSTPLIGDFVVRDTFMLFNLKSLNVFCKAVILQKLFEI